MNDGKTLQDGGAATGDFPQELKCQQGPTVPLDLEASGGTVFLGCTGPVGQSAPFITSIPLGATGCTMTVSVSPPASPAPAQNEKPYQMVQRLFSPHHPVLIHVPHKSKAPVANGWQKLTLDDMNPAYLARLTGNIGFLSGKASGDVCCIDLDSAEARKEFLDANTPLRETLERTGSRGSVIFVHFEGEYPKSCKLQDLEGVKCGEFRADGNQTIIHGIHPEGMPYRNNGKPIATIRYSDIVWPPGVQIKSKSDKAAKKAKPASADGAQGKKRLYPLWAVRAMLFSIPTRPDRETWMRISASVRNSLPNQIEALALLKEWSPEEEEGEYKELLGSCNFEEIGFGTLRHHAAQTGYNGVVESFYYLGKDGFGMACDGEIIPLGRDRTVCQHLQECGVPEERHTALLCRIRREQFVNYHGPLAGHPVGLRSFNGTKILVTRGPTIIQGRVGCFPFIQSVMDGLFEDEHYPAQKEKVMAWLCHARGLVKKGRREQSPTLCLIGLPGSGKSFFIDQILRPVLGGRRASAYRFLCGDKGFNADLAGAELWTVDDEVSSTSIAARRKFAQALKRDLFSASIRIEGKGKEAVDLDPISATVIALNDDLESLQAMPELDENVQDKLIICRTGRVDFPDALPTPDHKSARAKAELPGFIHHLESMDISDCYSSNGRFECFWHPVVVDLVNGNDPIMSLFSRIRDNDRLRTQIQEHGAWYGRASELFDFLENQCGEISSGGVSTCNMRQFGSWLSGLALKGRGITKTAILDGYAQYEITSNVWEVDQVDRNGGFR